MKEFRLTKRGKDLVKVTSQDRDAILDFLYENGTTSLDRLLGLDSDARSKLRLYTKQGLVEEVKDGFV